MQAMTLTRLDRRFVEKIWGIDQLPSPFPHPRPSRIGEIWYNPVECLPDLLVKRLFTSECLSVQVHPSAKIARKLGLGQTGKEEAWIIRAAEPNAVVALGFQRAVSQEDMRKAAQDGSIIDLLAWFEVQAGDVFHIPPGTVHAVGRGVDLIEIQQNCDITLRLFDHGRARELHLDQAMDAAEGSVYPASRRTTIEAAGGLLVDGPFFRIRHCTAKAPQSLEALPDKVSLVIPWRGDCAVSGTSLGEGECYYGTIAAEDIANSTCEVLIVEPAD